MRSISNILHFLLKCRTKKRVTRLCGLVALCTALSDTLNCTSQPGTTTVPTSTYYNSSVVSFSDTDTASGYVLFNAGFTLPAGGTVTMNVPLRIYGPITLGSAGTLILTGDMFFGSNVTLASGGATTTINGGGYTIFTEGNLTLPSSTTINITDNLTIDGGGHTITMPSTFNFNISNGKTLTIKNAFINVTAGADNFSIASGSGTIALRNSLINVPSGTAWVLSDDTTKITIQDDVVFRGGGSINFIPSSSSTTITINSFSSLIIDRGTTLMYGPGASASYTKTLFTFTDATSQLWLRGSTLSAPGDGTGYNGIKLSTGTLILEDTVTLRNYDFGTNTTINTTQTKAIELDSTLTVKILAGAYVDVQGYLKTD